MDASPGCAVVEEQMVLFPVSPGERGPCVLVQHQQTANVMVGWEGFELPVRAVITHELPPFAAGPAAGGREHEEGADAVRVGRRNMAPAPAIVMQQILLEGQIRVEGEPNILPGAGEEAGHGATGEGGQLLELPAAALVTPQLTDGGDFRIESAEESVLIVDKTGFEFAVGQG